MTPIVHWSELPSISTLPVARSDFTFTEQNKKIFEAYLALLNRYPNLGGAIVRSQRGNLHYHAYRYDDRLKGAVLAAHDGLLLCGQAYGQECALLASNGTILDTGELVHIYYDEKKARAETATKTVNPDETRSLAVIWDKYPGPIAGTINLSTGEIAFSPETGIQCSHFGEEKRTRTWAVRCNDGAIAIGKFEPLGSGKGSKGVGVDNSGNSVQFTIGPRR